VGLILGAIATVALGACSAAHPSSSVPSAGPLAATLATELTPLNAVAWSADRPLAWRDFQGQPPASGSEGALTAYSLFQALRCTGRSFEFRVVAAMLPHQSWVKPEVLASSALNARTLRHEQTHFDLSEVHARRMRKYFAGLYDPCGETEDRLRASADRFVQDEAAAQTRYDGETRHGLALDAQARWDRDTSERLAELREFAEQR
jgi:hypothetical protein